MERNVHWEIYTELLKFISNFKFHYSESANIIDHENQRIAELKCATQDQKKLYNLSLTDDLYLKDVSNIFKEKMSGKIHV